MNAATALLASAAVCIAGDRTSKRLASRYSTCLRFSDGPRILVRPAYARASLPLLAGLFLASLLSLAVAPGASPAAAGALTGAAFGGAASNLIEARRHRRGIDFIPVFPAVASNLADVAIGAGLAGRLAFLVI